MTGIVKYGILDLALFLQYGFEVACSGSRIAGIGVRVDSREGNRIELDWKAPNLVNYHSASLGKRQMNALVVSCQPS